MSFLYQEKLKSVIQKCGQKENYGCISKDVAVPQKDDKAVFHVLGTVLTT